VSEGDVVILGNRYEAQLCAIEQKASMIIVCDGAPVSKTIRKIAAANDCAVISTGYDTYAVARLINQSLPIRYFMTTEKLIAFQENSYIDDIRDIMMKARIRDFPIVTEDYRYTGMISRRNLIDMDKKQLILVDHNEPDQGIAGIQEAEILEIADHHKLGTIETIKPVVVRNQPVGCTATIVYQMYVENNIEISPSIAGLLCSAIISDTLLFRSPTCTPIDKIVALKLAEIAGINPETHAVAMFDAGSDLKSKSTEEIFYQDFKKFKAGDQSFGVGQITSMNAEELKVLKEKLKPFLDEARKKEDTDMIFFLLTDILSENSYLIYSGKDTEQVIIGGFNQQPMHDEVVLEGIVSRKKQFVPVVMGMLMA
jgi:manganese-dependent inorganic pyrophosphatase